MGVRGKQMAKPGTASMEGSRTSVLRRALIAIVLFALSCSLVTRFHSTIPATASVQCIASSAARQHMDRDAICWIAPVTSYAALETPNSYLRVAPAGVPMPALLLEQKLYNRPPPAC
jgi:hypothetical protein